MKILCVVVPHFPFRCEVMRRPSLEGKSAIITYTDGSQNLVLDSSLKLEGLQRDMPLQQALSHHGRVSLVPADEPYCRSVFSSLLDALEGISPLVEGANPGHICIGVDGLQLIYPNYEAIIEAVIKVIPDVFAPQIGIADNKFLAYVAAGSCPPNGHRILDSDVTDFLYNLPCDVLPIFAKAREKLQSFGLKTLGQD